VFSSHALVASAGDTIVNHDTLTDNMLSYWRLEEASGTRFDSNTAEGVIDLGDVVSAVQVPGLVGFGARCNHTPNYLADILNRWTTEIGTGPFTVAAWINAATIASNQTPFGSGIVSTLNSEANGQFQLTLNNNGQIYLAYWGTVDQRRVSDSVLIVTDVWFYILVTFSGGAGTFTIYRDNISFPHTNDGGQSSGWGAGTYIGRTHTGGPGNYSFDGIIDDVGLWNRVLTTQERTDLYNGGEGLPYA